MVPIAALPLEPLTVHVTAVFMALVTVAVNWRVVPTASFPVEGVTVTVMPSASASVGAMKDRVKSNVENCLSLIRGWSISVAISI